MIKSTNTEFTKRINAAIALLKQYPCPQATCKLMHDYGVSRRQAYRYIQEAQKVEGKLLVPEPKVVFTVKLPASLVCHLREQTKSREETLSYMVTQALEAFFKKGNHG